MSDLKELKSRIKSVQNIIKVTNAMYLISASKIAKLEIEEKKAKSFANKIKSTLSKLGAVSSFRDFKKDFYEDYYNPYLAKRKNRNLTTQPNS
jgi:F0F1-type ATP synthase gamma subunit